VPEPEVAHFIAAEFLGIKGTVIRASPPLERRLSIGDANLSAEAHSILSLYRALIDLRKATPQLGPGDCVSVAATGD
jgi:hypothetical protein